MTHEIKQCRDLSKVSLDKFRGAEGGQAQLIGDLIAVEESKQENASGGGLEGAGEGNFIGNVLGNLGLSKKKTTVAANNKRQAYYDNEESEAMDAGSFDVPDDDEVDT